MSNASIPVFPQPVHVPLPVVQLDDHNIENVQACRGTELDLDYFAINLNVEKLPLLGPFIQLVSNCHLTSIQDPIFSKFENGNVISVMPILAFDDFDCTFPIRSKFIEVLNRISPMPIIESEVKRKGAMVHKDHWIPTSSILEALQICGVTNLRYSMYGTKLSLSSLSENPNLVHLLSSSPEDKSFFDIAASSSSEDIVGVLLKSIPKRLPMLKVYPYFGYLLGGRVGGFSFSVANVLDFKWYTLVHHHLLANSKVSWLVPKSKTSLMNRQAGLQGLLKRLQCSPLQMGGYRVEIRFYQKSFWESVHLFQSHSLLDLELFNKWLLTFVDGEPKDLPPVSYETVSVERYLLYVDSILTLACVPPRESGILWIHEQVLRRQLGFRV